MSKTKTTKTAKTATIKIPAPTVVELSMESIVNQLVSGDADAKLVELLQAKDTELAKQEEEIRQQRSRIRTAIVHFDVPRLTIKPLNYIPPTKRDVGLLGCREGTIEAKVAGALADYIIANSLTSFTCPEFRDWCDKNNVGLSTVQISQMFNIWSRKGNLTKVGKNGVVVTHIAEGKLSAFVQCAQQVAQ